MGRTAAALAISLAISAVPAPAVLAAEPVEVRHGVAPKSAQVVGKVVAIDAAKLLLTVDHGEIAAFQMGPMTMAFRVKDAALLVGLRAGDAIRFTVAEEEEGDYVITRIEK